MLMAKELIVPKDKSNGHLRCKFTSKIPVVERPQRDREAQMYIVLICTSLWGLFWFQFVIGVVSNMPAIYWLSSGNWYPPPYEMYVKNSGPFPCSLAATFVFLSCFAAILGMIGAWMWTVGVHGKWRMRFAVLIFCFITVGWSIATLKAKDGMYADLDYRISNARENWRRAADWKYGEWELRRCRLEVEKWERIKAKLEAARER